MPAHYHPANRPGYVPKGTSQPQNPRTQHLPRLTTNFGSEESLHLPIQHPSPIKSKHPVIKRKAAKGRVVNQTLRERYQSQAASLHRRSSEALGQSDPYKDPSSRLKDSREDLLLQELVKGIFSPSAEYSNRSQERLNNIKMRMEPGREIMSPVSPLGSPQAGIYQPPANMAFLDQSIRDPHGRQQWVLKQQRLKRGNHVPKSARQPSARLRHHLKKQARPEFVVANGIRQERYQLQRTRQRLNGDEGTEPLLSRFKEEDLAEQFGREYEARVNGERRRMPDRKLTKPQHMLEGRNGLVQKATTKEDVSGWYGKNRKRDRALKKVKVIIAKLMFPKRNSWQHI